MITLDSILEIMNKTRGLPQEIRHRAFEIYANGYMTNKEYEIEYGEYYRIRKECEQKIKALDFIRQYKLGIKS